MINIEKNGIKYTLDYIQNKLSQHWENIGVNIFEWRRKNGKPLSSISEGLTSQRFEKCLYEDGKGLFFKDINNGYFILKCVEKDKRNIYNEPVKWNAIGFNYNKEYSIDNAVLIKNNALCEPTKDIVDFYCCKLADIELAKDLNRDANKTPFIFECDGDTVLTVKNIFKQIKCNEPAIFKNKNKGVNIGTTVLNTGAPFIIDKLEDDYHNYEARILTILGLDNYVEDKAERVQSAEVDAQNEYIISSFRSSLRERQIACEKINKMFGLDLEVVYVQGEQIETNEETSNEESSNEEIENEEVNNE